MQIFLSFLTIDCIQVKPPCSFTPKEIDQLTDRIQNGGTEVVEVQKYMFDLLLGIYILCCIFLYYVYNGLPLKHFTFVK